MSRIVVQAFISLDGVVQGGGGPDEDREGGFDLGGWSMDYDRAHDTDNELGLIIADWESRTEALLLGRKTYDIWNQAWAVWPEDAPGFMGELTRRYNRVPKYIASHTVDQFSWKNSHHFTSVEDVVTDQEGEIRIWGSTVLIRSLAEQGLIDEYRLAFYPIVLGQGKRLFPDGFPTTNLTVVNTIALNSGVVVTTFRPLR